MLLSLIKNNKRGFTLVELLLYSALAAVMLLAIGSLLTLIISAREKSQTIAEVEQEGLRVVQIISQALHNASSITAPAVGASGGTLTLTMHDTAKNPTIVNLQGGNIMMAEGAGGIAQTLTSNRLTASNLTFRNLSRSGTIGTIQIIFTLSHINPAVTNDYDYQRTFYGSATVR